MGGEDPRGHGLGMCVLSTDLGVREGCQCGGEGGSRSEWAQFQLLVIGYRTAWRPVNGSRHWMVVGKLYGRAAAAVLVVGWAHAMRRA